MSDKPFLKIGVFYDGSHFNYAQNFFFHTRKLGWLSYQPFQQMIENIIREHEQGYNNYKVVYAGWYQGSYHEKHATEAQLRTENKRFHDRMHSGIETKSIPMSESIGEKGIDIVMAIDALQTGLKGKIDVAVLVTADGDFVPLCRELMKNGIRVMAVYFEYKEKDRNNYVNERLLSACNYSLNVNSLENDKKHLSNFKGLFRSEKDLILKLTEVA